MTPAIDLKALAGKPAPARALVDLPKLITAYYTERPDPAVATERVAFGTSGHRGSSLERGFNEAHLLAMTQAICSYRRQEKITGPLFLGFDTHALSAPAFASALEVLAANGVETLIAAGDEYTPTPALSHAILTYNRGRTSGLADGIVITPSHNPPDSGGFKYNPPNGGPADTNITKWIENVADLGNVIDLEAIRGAKVRMGVDPLGGAGVHYWPAIAERYKLDLTIVNDVVDGTFRFMTLDWDGRIRMDPSSTFAMQGLIGLRDRYDVAFACDTDHDRHGIVTRSVGLLPPNHYLSVCMHYLLQNRSGWRADAGIGKTVVSSSIIDRIAKKLGRRLYEVPVGFKWFVDGMFDGSLGFVGEESAGASFLRRDGGVWTTDKDGIIPGLLSAEIIAKTGRDPGEAYREITRELGDPLFARVDAPATPAQKKLLGQLTPAQITSKELAGDPIERTLTRAPGNDQPIGGLKVETKNGWFAARPSGTEDVYKIYAESFRGEEHLRQIQQQAREIVSAAIEA